MRLIEEFRRRHVGRAAAVYVAVAWAATEILSFLFEKIPVFPAWADTVMALLFVLGFPVAMFLAWFFDFGPSGVKRTDPGSAVGKLTIAVSLLLLVGATAGLSLVLIPRLPGGADAAGPAGDDATGPAGADATGPAGDDAASSTGADGAARDGLLTEAPPNSVAVLPFLNLSPQEETGFFAEGVSEEILNGLAQVRSLRVASRTSSFSLRGQALDIREISQLLNVRHLVEGSVRRAGDSLRVTAQLVHAEDGYQLWSRTFDGTLADVFGFQNDIAEGVARALGEVLEEPGLGPQARTAGMTSNPEAYDRYLLARQIWRQRQEEPIRRSIELLREAVALDPAFASAWSALASANLTLPAYTQDPGEAPARAEEAAYRALALDNGQAEAHAVLGSLELARGAWIAAAARFAQAREIAPNNSTIRVWSSEFFAKTGQIERAISQIDTALELDPLYAPAMGNAGHQYASAGRLEEARVLFQKSWDLGLRAMFVWFGAYYVRLMQGHFDEAERWLEERPSIPGVEADRALLTALRQPSANTTSRAVSAVGEARAQGMGLREAVLYLSALGAVDEAFRLMEPAKDMGWIQTESLWSVWTEPLRQDPRFNPLVRALGLLDYWQLHGPPAHCSLAEGRLHCPD